MSDDEQRMREQFEANFLACSPMSLPSDFTRDSVGGYENNYLQQRWHGWVEGQRARDAEVQMLRVALAELVECAEEVRGMLPRPSGSLDYAIWQAQNLFGGEEGEVNGD